MNKEEAKFMNKEEAKHLSDVLKAYSEGKTIQERTFSPENGYSKWNDVDVEHGCISVYDSVYDKTKEYRIKTEPKLRPYKDAEEFLKALKEHGPYLDYIGGHTYLPLEVSNTTVWFFGIHAHFTEILDDCKWQDGTPCGILENENTV